jgi:hypothetical protein
MSGWGAALMACLVWFPLTSTTQDKSVVTPKEAARELAGLQLSAKVEFPEKAPSPKLVLEASNPGGTDLKVTLKLVYQETKINPMARMMPRPVTVWEKEVEVEIAAGKDAKFSFLEMCFSDLMKKEEASEFGEETLREVIVMCGKERVSLLGQGSRFPELDIK